MPLEFSSSTSRALIVARMADSSAPVFVLICNLFSSF